MSRLLGSSLLVLSLLVALPGDEASAQKDKDKKKKMDAPDVKVVDSAKLSGEFTGTLKSAPGSDRNFVLTVETKKLVNAGKGGAPKAGGNNNGLNRIVQLQNTIVRDQQQMLTARTPQQRQQYQQRLLRDQQQLQQAILQLQTGGAKAGNGGLPPGYKFDVVKQDVEFQAAEAVKVRTMLLPESFDDKGNKKTYSKEQLAELKGKDKAAPGYESSLEKLESGSKVRVVLGPAPPPAKKEAKEDKDADKDDVPADKRMQAKLIVVLEEAPPTKGKAPPKKK